MITKHDMAALRALRRLMNIHFEGWDEHAACDRQFDGGEFSDAANARMADDKAEQLVKIVAERFGMPAWSLGEKYLYLENYEGDMQMAAMIGRRGASRLCPWAEDIIAERNQPVGGAL